MAWQSVRQLAWGRFTLRFPSAKGQEESKRFQKESSRVLRVAPSTRAALKTFFGGTCPPMLDRFLTLSLDWKLITFGAVEHI